MASSYEQVPLEAEILTKEKYPKKESREKEADFVKLANDYGQLAYLELRRFMEVAGAKISPEREKEMAQKLKIDGIDKKGNPIIVEAIKHGCFCFGDFCLSPQGEKFNNLEEVEKYNQEVRDGEIGEELIKEPEGYVEIVKQWLGKQPVITEKISDKIAGYRNPYGQGGGSVWARRQLALAHLAGFGQAAFLLGDKETQKLVAAVLEKQLERR